MRIKTTGAILLLWIYLTARPAVSQTTEPSPSVAEFARQVEAIFRAGDGKALASVTDRQAFARRATVGSETAQDRPGSMTEMLTGSSRYFDLIASSAQDGSYRYLRARSIKGETHILFRLVSKGGRIIYDDWILSRAPGAMKLLDRFSSFYGELESQILHETDAEVAVHNALAIRHPLSPEDDSFRKWESYSNINDPLKQMEIFRDLPDYAKRGKLNLLTYYGLAETVEKVRPAEKGAALAELQRLFPDDFCLDSIYLNSSTVQCDRAQILKSIDRFQQFTGGDRYVNVALGRFDLNVGSQESLLLASKELRQAIEGEPNVKLAYQLLIRSLLGLRDYDAIARTLDEMQLKLHSRFRDLREIPQYADFVQSEAYRRWLARQVAKPAK